MLVSIAWESERNAKANSLIQHDYIITKPELERQKQADVGNLKEQMQSLILAHQFGLPRYHEQCAGNDMLDASGCLTT